MRAFQGVCLRREPALDKKLTPTAAGAEHVGPVGEGTSAEAQAGGDDEPAGRSLGARRTGEIDPRLPLFLVSVAGRMRGTLSGFYSGFVLVGFLLIGLWNSKAGLRRQITNEVHDMQHLFV